MSHKLKTTIPLVLIVFAGAACHPARYGVARPAQAVPAPEPVIEPVKPLPPKETIVTFGTDGVFHLGDAIFGGSTCKPKLEALPLNGTKFHFKFEVLSESSTVDLAISDLCGVDLANNTFEINSDVSVFAPAAIPLNQESLQIPTLSLKKGVYTLTISSGKNEDNPNFAIGNYDDLIVGKVQMKGVNIQSAGYSAE